MGTFVDVAILALVLVGILFFFAQPYSIIPGNFESASAVDLIPLGIIFGLLYILFMGKK